MNQPPVLSQRFALSLYNGQFFWNLVGTASKNFSFLLFNGQKSAVCWVWRWEKFFCGSCFPLRRFSKPCAAIELAKLCRWARLPQPSGCVKQGLGKALPNKIPMGQNERNAKSGTSVESCSLLLQTSLHFTTDIFSAKSRVCICKYSVNEQLSSVIRRCNFFCFYGIAAAAGLRRTNGNIANTIRNIDRWDFLSLYPYYNLKNAFWPSFRWYLVCDKKA